MNIVEALDSPEVFAPLLRDPSTWAAWRCFLLALFGLPMSEEETALYRTCTGRSDPPSVPCSEAWLVIGRRGGKSFTLSLIACFLACFIDWRPYLGPGERATIMVIAADRKQARVIMRYVKGILQQVPMLAQTIEAERAEAVDLTSRITIEVHTASFRTVRGYTIVAALLDELAFWQGEDSSNPDSEVIAAIKPAMATVPEAMLLCASSPYARRGALYDAHRRHHAKEGDPVLVWQAPTRVMNPSIPQHIIDDAFEDDPVSAAAEYGAEFRTDIEGFVTREIVNSCIDAGVHERMALRNTHYVGFVDPSGGSSDSFTVAIGHEEKGKGVLDVLREVRPPFSPTSVVEEFATLLKTYRINRIQGDRYAGEWPREAFAKHGIKYEPSAKPKSDLYRDLLPLLNSEQVSLLDLPRLTSQLVSLERRTARSGRDSIDHAPGGHDDVANAVAGVLTSVAGSDSAAAYTYGLMHNVSNKPGERSRYSFGRGLTL